MVDLNRLLSKHRMIPEYVCKLDENHYYDHEVKYSDETLGTRINDGHVYKYKNTDKRLPGDHYIVKIIKD